MIKNIPRSDRENMIECMLEILHSYIYIDTFLWICSIDIHYTYYTNVYIFLL